MRGRITDVILGTLMALVLAVLVTLWVDGTFRTNTTPHVQALTYDGPYEDGSGTISYLIGGKAYRIGYCLPKWPCGVEGP